MALVMPTGPAAACDTAFPAYCVQDGGMRKIRNAPVESFRAFLLSTLTDVSSGSCEIERARGGSGGGVTW